MTPENFVYWLNGFVELSGNPPTPEQWQSIKEHLQLVMTKVTPPVKNPNDTFVEHMQNIANKFQQESPDWQKDLLRGKITC